MPGYDITFNASGSTHPAAQGPYVQVRATLEHEGETYTEDQVIMSWDGTLSAEKLDRAMNRLELRLMINAEFDARVRENREAVCAELIDKYRAMFNIK